MPVINFLYDCMAVAAQNIVGLIVILCIGVCGMTGAEELRRWLGRR